MFDAVAERRTIKSPLFTQIAAAVTVLLVGLLAGAMLLQTLAYTVIAGKSVADGVVLSGISMLLIGFLPESHPMIRGPFFETVRLWIIGAGMILLLTGLLILNSSHFFDQKISNLLFLGYFRIGFKRMRLSKKLYGYNLFQ